MNLDDLSPDETTTAAAAAASTVETLESSTELCRWLTTVEAASLMRSLADRGEPLHRQLQRLRRGADGLSPAAASAVTQQVALRRRALSKFPAADQMLFTAKLLEQSTDYAIAMYKASRFPKDVVVADLCCGMGGDLLALAARGPVVGVDADPIAIELARHNATAAAESDRPADVRLVCHPVEDVLRQLKSGKGNANNAGYPGAAWAWAHIDPDRRPDGVRTSGWEYSQPGPNTLEALREGLDGLAVKLAPAADIPADWNELSQREWIGSRGECRQQVVWCGELASEPGMRTATVVDGARVSQFHAASDEQQPLLASARSFGDYLLEPHPAVLGAQLGEAFAAAHQLEVAAAHGGYLTGDQLPPGDVSRLTAKFAIEEVLPFDVKRLRARLRAHPPARLEVKRRGIPDTPEQILKRLKWNSGKKSTGASNDVLTLIIAKYDRQAAAIFARRIPD